MNYKLYLYKILTSTYEALTEKHVRRVITKQSHKSTEKYIEVMAVKGGIEIRGSGPLLIEPQVSNVVTIKLRRF